MTENKKFQRFGKYLILDHLVDGGMAKICRARYLGEQANKVVAIKMVQPQFSNDDAFVRMFQDELNITFGMLHPNIMQVYDYGKTNGQLYTAMEYIHGANLKQYLDRLKEKKVVFPVEISCFIISQVCLGLHYAHTFTDKLTGKPYNIIHRDISPHNIMLTYDGDVKVIDFGIAKANTNSEATQAGTIKGKLSYLAPEYLDGLELDARYDEFAVGITLWELLCSRKLFQANNDLAVLKQIQACKIIPPSQINPLVPKELDAIVMKALSKDRAQRYENLDQLNRALVRFLYAQYPDFNASDLKMFADDLFRKEIETDREKFVEYGKINIHAYIEDMKNDEHKTTKLDSSESDLRPREGTRLREIDLVMESDQSQKIEIGQSPVEKTSTKIMHRGSPAADPNAHRPGQNVKKTQKSVSRVMTRKEIEEDRSVFKSSRFVLFLAAASVAGIFYFQSDLMEDLTGINLKKMIHGDESSRKISSVNSEEKKRKDSTTQTKKDEATGELILRGINIEMEVYLDGVKTNYVGSPLEVALNREVVIRIKRAGFLPFIKKITLNKEENSAIIDIPELERARSGLLTTSLNYAAGSKLVYEEAGQIVERELPFKEVQITEGHYQAKIINSILGTEKQVEFTIEENKKQFLE